MSHYSIKVSWSDQDAMFVAVCPALGDVSALGETAQRAVAELEQAIELALETYESEGWPIPEPDSMEEYSGQFRLRLPRSLHAWLAHEAERQGISLNSLVSSVLAHAQGAAETRVAMTEEVSAAITALRTSLATTMSDAIVEVSADSSTSSDHELQPDIQQYGSSSNTFRLVRSAG